MLTSEGREAVLAVAKLRRHSEESKARMSATKIGFQETPAQRAAGIRICSKCRNEKPLTEYYVLKSGGIHRQCKACLRERRKKYVLANKEQVALRKKAYAREHRESIRAYQREWARAKKTKNMPYRSQRGRYERYGLTPEEWQGMFERQGRCCAICKTSVTDGRGWATDHDHLSGVVRGILCHRCNSMLGFAKDRPSVLEDASAYLTQRLPFVEDFYEPARV